MNVETAREYIMTTAQEWARFVAEDVMTDSQVNKLACGRLGDMLLVLAAYQYAIANLPEQDWATIKKLVSKMKIALQYED